MNKAIKIIAIIFLSFITVIAGLYFTYLIITKDAVLDSNKLIGASRNVLIYDDDGNELTSASLDAQKKSVAVSSLQKHTVNAFIASEDRTFYRHNGLNYKRMLKALYKNITSGSFKEGASTISQQLIKNTHLSNNKTIKRKLNEIRLTKQLEKRYEKDEILEMYLNTIYFGHNCYGLQSAAEFYFNKKAENLDIAESATIVGLLTSPNNYSPFKNPEKSLKRRNIVLGSMLECGYIDRQTYNETIEMPLNTVRTLSENNFGDYVDGVFDELEELNLDYYSLNDGCKIHTYMNRNVQSFIENLNYPCDNAVIVNDNSTSGVRAYKSVLNGAKRQPGSTVKPIFVYAPSIEEKNISPFSKIQDEKVDFNGYSPENYDKRYHGTVTVTESLKNSYNIPAVKTLNSLTIRKCEKYLAAMDIELDNDEKNLSLALGGMKHGLSIKELADKYSVFPNGGNYRPSRFIKKITDKDGKTIYKNDVTANNVFSEGTCSLVNEMLIETTKSGTAKKLKEFQFDIASKTGTCGNAEGNTDAYAVSYTSDSCIAVWLGNKDNSRTEITGGNDCCKIMKSIITNIYDGRTPAPLETEKGTVKIDIDREEYSENDKVILADPVCPKLNIMTVKVLKGNRPSIQSDRFSHPTIPKPDIKVENNTVNIQLCQTKYYSFIIKRVNNGKTDIIYDGKWQKCVTDSPKEGIYTYSVTPYYDNGKEKFVGAEIKLSPVNISFGDGNEPQIKIPDIANKDWYNQ